MPTYANAIVLTPINITRAGVSCLHGLVAANATDGNKFINDGRTWLRVKNGSAAPITVTIQVQNTLDGLQLPSPTVTLNATGDANGLDTQDIGPFTKTFEQTDGYIWAVCSAVTSVTIGAYRQALP